MNKYLHIIKRIQHLSFLLVLFLLPFPRIMVRYAILAWFVLWLAEGRWLHRPQPISNNKAAIPILLFGAWYALKLLSGIWAPDHEAWLSYLERQATFAALIPVGIWGINDQYDWRKALNSVVLGCLAASLLYPFTLFWVTNHDYFIPLAGRGELHTMNWMWYADKVSYIKHRLFFCTVLLGGMISSIALIGDWQKRFGRIEGVALAVVSVLSMLTAIWLTGSRQTLLTIPVLLIVALCIRFKQRQILRHGIWLVILLLIAGSMVYNYHPRMHKIDKEELLDIRTPDMEREVRLNIWAFSTATPSDYIAYGLGAGQATNYLRAQYSKAGWEQYLLQGYNACHCQYLTEVVENGIFGLCFFIICWVALLYYNHNGKQWWAAALLCVVYGMNMFTDDMMARYDSIAIWSAWMVLILILGNETKQEAEGTNNNNYNLSISE